jgi:hypothetical protein
MKKWFGLLSLLIALSLFLAIPVASFADEDDLELEDKAELEEDDEEKGPKKEWVRIKKALQVDKDLIEADKDLLEEELELLEADLKAAEEAGDEALVLSLKAEIEGLKVQFFEIKDLMKLRIREMQQVMKEKYTQDEWNALMANAEELESIAGIKILPAENILMPGKNLKFDVPPVIKEGRLLVPIRAISTALGADVTWDNENKTGTIVYGDIEIKIAIIEGTFTVNGEAVETDVPAEIMNGRIVVPLRFIVENMGLEIEWDGETETAEIKE